MGTDNLGLLTVKRLMSSLLEFTKFGFSLMKIGQIWALHSNPYFSFLKYYLCKYIYNSNKYISFDN